MRLGRKPEPKRLLWYSITWQDAAPSAPYLCCFSSFGAAWCRTERRFFVRRLHQAAPKLRAPVCGFIPVCGFLIWHGACNLINLALWYKSALLELRRSKLARSPKSRIIFLIAFMIFYELNIWFFNELNLLVYFIYVVFMISGFNICVCCILQHLEAGTLPKTLGNHKNIINFI